jgi:hypothetical protein
MSEEHGIDSHKLTKHQLMAKVATLNNELFELQAKYDHLRKVYSRTLVANEGLHLYIEHER